MIPIKLTRPAIVTHRENEALLATLIKVISNDLITGKCTKCRIALGIVSTTATLEVEILDLLCVSVQAGLSFDASLHKITGRMKGPLVDEFRRFQDDVSMGMIRRTAMKNMAVRCELQDVSLFMTALIQAEKLGTSMGKTLRNQSDNIRERRRQYVKAQAMKAPVKIVFPLVLFIFPAIFVVALVPTLLSLMKNM